MKSHPAHESKTVVTLENLPTLPKGPAPGGSRSKTVWVVRVNQSYEGRMLVGIYETREAAELALPGLLAIHCHSDPEELENLEISQWAVRS